MEKLKYRTYLIEIFLAVHELSKEEFCKRCGIKQATLTKILNHEDCALLTLYKVTNFMHITLKQFYQK